MSGLAPLEPSLTLLSSLSTTIQTAISSYENAQTPAEKASALQKIQVVSAKLSQATTPIQQQFMERNFGPNTNVALRIALEMSLFESLPSMPSSISISSLANKVNAEEEFVLRIARALGAFDILNETEDGYSHTPLSQFLLNPAGKASSKHLFDNMLFAQVNSGVEYYKQNGFKNPENAKNSPVTFAHGKKDMNIFDILGTLPDKFALFNAAMSITSVLGLKEVAKTYPFDELVPNEDGITLVDVGGGKGHVILEIKTVYPELEGFMLQDMKTVLDGGVVVDDSVKLQTYDFFKELQPIKGSNYILKSILHDWPDSDCLLILSNMAPAMRASSSSRLLICELVLPDINPSKNAVLRDMNMLVIGGKERNVKQWNELLRVAGFKILQIYAMGSPNSSIIEAVLEE